MNKRDYTASFSADAIFATLPDAMGCTVVYGGASLSPAYKLTRTGEWVTEIYGVASQYSFSVYTTATAATALSIDMGRQITVDGTVYGVMGIDKKSMASYWRIDCESIHR